MLNAVRTGDRTIDGATVQVHADVSAMARAAADEAAAVLRAAVTARGMAHAMFATGNSQLAFVEALVHETEGVPWADTVVFHMDEYVGVGPDHPAGFQRWIRERIVEPAHPKAAHYVEGLGDAGGSEPALRRAPAPVPARPVLPRRSARTGTWPSTTHRWPTSPTRWTSRWSSSRRHVGSSRSTKATFPDWTRCPTHAITVTIPALLRARRVLAIVPEARKAAAGCDALTGPITDGVPGVGPADDLPRHHPPRARLGTAAPRLNRRTARRLKTPDAP